MKNYRAYNLPNMFLIADMDSHDYIVKHCESNNIKYRYDIFDIIKSDEDSDGYLLDFNIRNSHIINRIHHIVKFEDTQEKPIVLFLRDIKVNNIDCVERLFYSSISDDVDIRAINTDINETEYRHSEIPELDTILKLSYRLAEKLPFEYFLNSFLKESGLVNIGISENNLIISGTKIASTWTAALAYNYIKKNIDSNITELECRDVSSFLINNDTIEFDNHKQNKYHQEVRILYQDILNSKTDGKIFILIRNPITRYIQSLKQDLFSYINSTNSVYETITNLLKNEQLYNIDLYFNQNKFHTIEGFIDYNIKNIETVEVLIKNLFKLFFKTSTSTNNWYSGAIRTAHYTKFYSSIFTLINGIDKRHIFILDIDTDDISDKILSSNRNSKKNKTNKLIKSIFIESFLEVIKTNPDIRGEIESLIDSDIAIYKILKKFNKL